MAKTVSRRDFLKVSVRGTAALAGAATFGGLASASAPGPVGDVSVWITDGTQRLRRAGSLGWRSAPAARAQVTVIVDADKKFQEILGFGAAFTDASCFTF